LGLFAFLAPEAPCSVLAAAEVDRLQQSAATSPSISLLAMLETLSLSPSEGGTYFMAPTTEPKKLIRATISVHKEDYEAMGKLAEAMDVSASWLMRKAMREFLDRYGEQGQPELALDLANKHKKTD
jgi:hypothetical protein